RPRSGRLCAFSVMDEVNNPARLPLGRVKLTSDQETCYWNVRAWRDIADLQDVDLISRGRSGAVVPATQSEANVL
ncbi:hypothetical protein ACC733_37115, partial [Rhizobium johnstonii]|uniref:hypothetical protein n=1 Tax=Rhizobium johnstonii TaxID=3019933 RepID=UPI003F9A44AB